MAKERIDLHGTWLLEFRDAAGVLFHSEQIENLVCTEGKNTLLDAALAGSSYTVTGPYIGLISSASFSALAQSDVGTQINGTNGWKEAGNANAPTYSGGRTLATWSAAASGSKKLAAPFTITFTGTGIVQGVFMLFGSGATSTIDSAAGKLLSESALSTPQTVVSTNTLTFSYQMNS